MQADFIKEASSIPSAAPVMDEIKSRRKEARLDYIIEDTAKLTAESISGAERIKRIVQNLTGFSTTDKAAYKMENINECLDSSLNILTAEMKDRVLIKKDYGDIPFTRIDTSRFRQACLNLLLNAVQAIEQHGEIYIKTRSDNKNIYISISDTGRGIPPGIINRIFEPFFTTKEVGKGTGLGLSVAYDIVKQHNGNIKVESIPGKGTTFDIEIPIIGEAAING